MSFPPDVYLIGAMKAGTTSLADLLSKHPIISLSSPKEPHFFTKNLGQDLAWYESCFKEPQNRICIDASTSYSIAPVPGPFKYRRECDHYYGIPKKIKELNPTAKIIYIIRNPVARTYSHYTHNMRSGWEKRPFIQAIAEDSQYLSASNYAAQLSLYQEYFPPEAIMTLLFEEFIKSPELIAQECFDFLGIHRLDSAPLDHVKNKSFLYNELGEKLHRLGVMKIISRMLPTPFKHALAPLVTRPIPKLSNPDREFLIKHFTPLNAELANQTGLDLSAWTKF